MTRDEFIILALCITILGACVVMNSCHVTVTLKPDFTLISKKH